MVDMYMTSDEVLQGRWSLGWKDRGMGHGSYAILMEDTGQVIGEPFISEDVPQHIIDLHNEGLNK